MTEHILPYDHSVVPQETFFDCGPASTQVVLNSRGIIVSERDLIDQIGTTTDGTGSVDWITPVLNAYLGGGYVSRFIGNDPPSQAQKDLLWADIVASIDAGFGVVVNIDAPVSNYPRGVKGSASPAYGGGEVEHYIAAMGYDDDPALRAVWIADPGFPPNGYWVSFDQLASLIPPKGYTAAPNHPAAQSNPATPGKVPMRQGLDYAGGRPGGGAIRAAGYDFVVRYLSDGGPGLPGKLLTPEEADDLRANGVSIVSNWETTADRMLGGYDAGVHDAGLALAQVLACGGRHDRPIYFSADWDTTPEQQVPIDDYLRGAASVIGAENVGIYAGFWAGSRALDNGTARWLWQTDAWSGDNLDGRRNIHQLIQTVNVGGVDCDVNEAQTDDFGQWDYAAPAAPAAPTPEVPAVPELNSADPVVNDIEEQLRGPDKKGWPQLGQNASGENLTLVDGLAKALSDIAAVRADVEAIKAAVVKP